MQDALLVDGALDDKEIGLRLGGDPPCHRMVRIDEKRCRLLHLGRGRIGMRKRKARHAVSQGGFADALGARQQERMRHAAGTISRQQRRLRQAMAEQRRRKARMRDFAGTVLVVGARAHEAPTSLRRAGMLTGKVNGSSLAPTTLQILRATISFGALASMTTQRSGCSAAIAR